MRILITGGAGYIGSHTLVEVLRAGHEAHVVDNLGNASPVALARVKQLANRDFGFTRADIRDAAAMAESLSAETREAVMAEVSGAVRTVNGYEARKAMRLPQWIKSEAEAA